MGLDACHLAESDDAVKRSFLDLEQGKTIICQRAAMNDDALDEGLAREGGLEQDAGGERGLLTQVFSNSFRVSSKPPHVISPVSGHRFEKSYQLGPARRSVILTLHGQSAHTLSRGLGCKRLASAPLR